MIQAHPRINPGVKRIAWVDIARGIGILLVVFGHLQTGFSERVIYAFHMPFFFLLSGYVHKTQNDCAKFFRKRFINLIVPYVSFLIVLAPLELRHASHSGKLAVKQKILDMLWGGDHLHGDCGVFWFITCLFATQQIVNWLLTKCKLWKIGAVVTLSLCLAYINSLIFPLFTLPFDLNVVACALPLYLAGYFARDVDLDRWWIIWAAIVGVIATLWLAFFNVPISYDMRSAVYGVPILSLLLAVCCSMFVVRISKLLMFSPPARTMLEMIGTASLGIMFIHKPLPALPYLGRLACIHPLVAFVVFCSIAYGCTMILSRCILGRALFLGSQKDFQVLISDFRGAASELPRDLSH